MEGLKEAILKGFEPELVVTLEAMPGKQVRMNLLKTIISNKLDKTYETIESNQDGKIVFFIKLRD